MLDYMLFVNMWKSFFRKWFSEYLFGVDQNKRLEAKPKNLAKVDAVVKFLQEKGALHSF